ncbi:uncharacterized protein si:ch211-93g23.2 [Leucoraja erinacea]|uniref:uncharacterized protein si:ch211-93g23.2 n=1 Tax=Leucoraja erinaceus TaxID=7782 RepID=UPI0024577486|nr:uncharacterized protein si:ch211-93g23.2 [Leucoraja erinacea]
MCFHLQNGWQFGLAVDVGSVSGQSSMGLAPYFDEVVGIDVSEAQIEEANKMCGLDNVFYGYFISVHVTSLNRQGVAEKLDFKDASVDLVTAAAAAAAARWFDIKAFNLRRLRRGPNDMVHFHWKLIPHSYHSLSKEIPPHVTPHVTPYESEKVQIVRNKYKEVFDTITFFDKERLEKIILKILLNCPKKASKDMNLDIIPKWLDFHFKV